MDLTNTKDTEGKIGATTWKSLGLMFQYGSAYAQASTALPNTSNLPSLATLNRVEPKVSSNGQGINNNGGTSSGTPVNNGVKSQDKNFFGSGTQQSYEKDKTPPIDAGIFVIRTTEGVSNKQMVENGTINIISENKGVSVETELYKENNYNAKLEVGTDDKKIIFIKPSVNGNGFQIYLTGGNNQGIGFGITNEINSSTEQSNSIEISSNVYRVTLARIVPILRGLFPVIPAYNQ